MTTTLALPLADAIDAGATIVTPNNRLARRLTVLHDEAMRASGRLAWPAANVLPWRAWLGTLWLEHNGDARTTAQRLLAPAQSAFLWRRIVGDDLKGDLPLADPRGAAALAADAWATLHAYGNGGASLRGFAARGDDEGAFVRWADRYAAALSRLGAEDGARVADALARSPPPMRERAIVLAGFLELDPQQRRLLDALERGGAAVAHADPLLERAALTIRVEARSPIDEITAALSWAKERVLADPAATIGVAIENLAGRRDEIVALAEDVLCPHLQWPGNESAPRPYNVSLGRSLADVPIVAAALDLIALAHAPLPLGRAVALIRSPYVDGATQHWAQRAATERRWLADGRRDIDEAVYASALARHSSFALRESPRRKVPLARRATTRAFAEAWRERLADAGWPGERTLDSAEWQARHAFDELVASFAALAPVARDLSAADALAALRALATETMFQPESSRAPIQILGLLEAAGMPFDALWIAGLSADRWPPPPRPHPLLPLAWQRERDVPHSSALRELTYARALTDQLARAAPQVIASHAAFVDDHPCLPSSITASWPLATAGATPARTAAAQFADRPALERIADAAAPPLVGNDPVRGGANLVEAQSECPFRATALYRLRVEPWRSASAGLAPWERGRLMHAALAALWRDLGTHAALVAQSRSDLDSRIGAAVDEAIAKTGATRMRMLPPLVAASEPLRLCELVRDWVDAVERVRPPFVVRAVESAAELQLGGLVLSLRLDRIDALADGGVAIIDYKTGVLAPLRQWFARRPRATQLGLYALALRAARDEPLRAVALAPVGAGTSRPAGIASDEHAWPGLALPREIGSVALPDWPALEAWWIDTLGALARDFASGNAVVDPRERTICARCALQSLCRIDAARPSEEDSTDG